MSETRPLARSEGLLVREMGEEILILDKDRNAAHCLNRAAALVWKHCDGRHSESAIAAEVAAALQAPVDLDLVRFALAQLDSDGLLADEPLMPSRVSRKAMMQRVGVGTALIAVPAITSIAIGTARAHASACLPPGDACSTGAQCCSGTCKSDQTCM